MTNSGPVALPKSIAILPAPVAAAIAAGEVIERPASVVKELLENALDAGARHVSVEVEGGGIQLIRVVDDGVGLSRDDLSLAFRAHATSKLRTVADLDRVSTYGFRGEALSSIAAAGVVSLRSCPAGDPHPLVVVTEGAGVSDPRPVAGPQGTEVTVRDLFAEVPARRRFLRSLKLEAAWCVRVAAEQALARPDVALEVRVDGRRALSTTGSGDLRQAVHAVFGGAAAERALPTSVAEPPFLVRGLVGSPDLARGNRNALVLMVNGRRVQQRALVAAVEGAYRGLLPEGRHPLAVLDLVCGPGDVDVNVHPTKREVRFRDEGSAFRAVQRSVFEALRQVRTTSLPLAPVRGPADGTGNGSLNSLPSPPDLPMPDGIAMVAPRLQTAAGWRYLGQAHRRYLVVETDEGVCLIDQHAAHEKVLYERARCAFSERRSLASQVLLQPVLIERDAHSMQLILDSVEELASLGLELETFGAGVLRCTATPAGMAASEVAALLDDLASEQGSSRSGYEERLHRAAATFACHRAIRFGDAIADEQARELLRNLGDTSGGIRCPHGRPAILALSQGQLLSAFGRR